MSQIIEMSVTEIDSNPYRNLADYPYVERKIDALKRSIEDVGLWEGVIGRRAGNRIEIAFGHHRVEAAKRSGLKKINVILRDLDDGEMLAFMGRENMEDYNSDFLTLLETWQAASEYLTSRDVSDLQVIEIARLLGWTQPRTGGGDQMNRTAEACNGAMTLLDAGYIDRENLIDLTVNDAREILVRGNATMKQLEKMGEQGGRSKAEINKAKQQVGKAVKATAKEAREGTVAKNNLRSRVDTNTYREAKKAKVKTPLFDEFGKKLAGQIEKMLESDSASTKLAEIQTVLDDVDMLEDQQIVSRIQFNLDELSVRASRWSNRLDTNKVVHLGTVKGGSNE